MDSSSRGAACPPLPPGGAGGGPAHPLVVVVFSLAFLHGVRCDSHHHALLVASAAAMLATDTGAMHLLRGRLRRSPGQYTLIFANYLAGSLKVDMDIRSAMYNVDPAVASVFDEMIERKEEEKDGW